MKRFYILLVLSVLICAVNAQVSYHFGYLTNAEGLSSGAISAIYKDSDGMMWFGSWDGLNSYDGRNVTVFKSKLNDANTLTSSTILNIVGERVKNEIWVTTFRGINRINTKSHQVDRFSFGFDSIMPLHYKTFNAVCVNETVYCAVYGASLFYYHAENNAFNSLQVFPKGTFVTKLLSDGLNNLWIYNNKGQLYRYTPRVNADGSQEIGQYEQVLKDIAINAVFKKDKDSFWIIDYNATLFLFDTRTNQLTLITRLAGKIKGDISAMAQKEDGIYIATSKSGLWVYSYRNDQLARLDGFEDQWVLSMNYCSKQDILWFGTNGNGVVQMFPNNRLFNAIENDKLLQTYKKSQIRSIYEDVNGDIWIGSRGDGISIISDIGTDKQRINHLSATKGRLIMAIVKGANDDIFIGTEMDTLLLFRNNSLINVDMPSEIIENLSNNGVYSMLWDAEREVLWLGTNGKGLFRLRMEGSPTGYKVVDYKRYYSEQNKRHSISNDNCYAILQADSNHLWIGTRGGGINLMDIEQETFTAINRSSKTRLSDDEVFSLAHAHDGGIWVGTGYGLNKINIDPKGEISVRYFTEDDGVLNNTIHGIVEDDHQIVWVSTNKGITRIDPINSIISNYSNGYGLQSNEFSDLAYLKASDGTIYFGGINGINFFSPLHIKQRDFIPQIKITSLVLNNTSYLPAEKTKSVNGKDFIFLAHNENFFNINFVALDFIDNSNCEYMYILEGFNKEWIKSGVNNSAVFTNVPPGRYTFRIRSTNGDKVWRDNEYTQEIEIGTPLWNSWRAYIFYTILLLVTALLAFLLTNRRLKLKRALLAERLEQQQQQLVHDAQLRFFSNIAHEIVTPRTLIYAPVEKLISTHKLDGRADRYLKVIKANSERMRKLIGELMNFRKIDAANQDLSLENIDVGELVSYISDNFTGFAEQMSIRFTSRIVPDDSQWVTDRSSFEKILFNLISNAYKYTNENGYIDLSISVDSDHLTMVLRNTGKGIKASEIDSVFDNFHILENFEKQVKEGVIHRTGIGLALTKRLVAQLGGSISVSSEENEFVEFRMTLPKQSLPASEAEIKIVPTATEKDDEALFTDSQHKQSILVVENEYQIRELIKDILQDDFTVIDASNGVEALEHIKKKRPNLIISDIDMPFMNGFELLEELKNNKLTTHIPVVFLSAKATIEDQIIGIKKGLEYFIPKPFNPRHLEVVINQILNDRKHLKDYYSSQLVNQGEPQGKFIYPEDQAFIDKITEIVESNIENEELNATFICNEMIISRIQLYRKLKKIAGVTPSDFIRQIKLKYASVLLKTTNLTVQEIMFKSGFNNRSYFYSVFKKEFNVSPLDLRENKQDLL